MIKELSGLIRGCVDNISRQFSRRSLALLFISSSISDFKGKHVRLHKTDRAVTSHYMESHTFRCGKVDIRNLKQYKLQSEILLCNFKIDKM